jgi:uncharacterized protein (TIGR02996 family)
MTHEQAFLADILGNPDDPGPRLVYADWLDEQGRPEQATFWHTIVLRPRRFCEPSESQVLW